MIFYNAIVITSDQMLRWYIQNEVVSGAYGSGNKFGIERIKRFKAVTSVVRVSKEGGMTCFQCGVFSLPRARISLQIG